MKKLSVSSHGLNLDFGSYYLHNPGQITVPPFIYLRNDPSDTLTTKVTASCIIITFLGGRTEEANTCQDLGFGTDEKKMNLLPSCLIPDAHNIR